MKISELQEKLEAFKVNNGDLEVFIDLENVEQHSGHGEYTHEEAIRLSIESILQYDADKGLMIPNSQRDVLSIGIDL